MVDVIELENGKSYTLPGMFVNPQTEDAMNAIMDNSFSQNFDNIDGIYLQFKDSSLTKHFQNERFDIPSIEHDWHKKILLIDPSFDVILDGIKNENKSMFKKIFSPRFSKEYSEILNKSEQEKITTSERDDLILKLLQNMSFKPLLDFQ